MAASTSRNTWTRSACMTLALMCLFIQEATVASAWPTTKFKVDFSTLTQTNSPGQSDLQNIPDPNRKTAPDFEPGSPVENDKKDAPGDRGERNWKKTWRPG